MATSAYLHLTITNVDTPLFEGKVASVSVPGTEGVMTILAYHEPIVSLLKAGSVVVRVAGEDAKEFTIENGVLEVSNNQVTILL